MATKKANSKSTKKTVAKEEPVVEATETKGVDTMSVDELANMFIQNDTQTIESLKAENSQVPEPVEPEQSTIETEKENELEKLLRDVVAEQPKEELKKEPKPKQEQQKTAEPKKNEQPEQVQPKVPKQSNTNRAVYGYDHFGIIYGY